MKARFQPQLKELYHFNKNKPATDKMQYKIYGTNLHINNELVKDDVLTPTSSQLTDYSSENDEIMEKITLAHSEVIKEKGSKFIAHAASISPRRQKHLH